MHKNTSDANIRYQFGSHALLKPQIVLRLPSQRIEKSGTEVRFTCLLTGYPSQVHWYSNGVKVCRTSDGRVTLENNGRDLIIKNIQSDDEGSIMFVAKNKYGECSGCCHIKVDDTSRDVSSTRQRISKVLEIMSPTRRISQVVNTMSTPFQHLKRVLSHDDDIGRS